MYIYILCEHLDDKFIGSDWFEHLMVAYTINTKFSNVGSNDEISGVKETKSATMNIFRKNLFSF